MSGNQQDFILDKLFTIRLEMLSDWHVGTGTGIPGNIDALLAKDSEGFAHVPAKTIVGIWRDAMETLTLGLDGGTEGNWSEWVEVIFGSQPTVKKIPDKKPRPAILALQPARINENLRKKINSFNGLDQTKYKQALTFIKPEIKIEENSGTSANDMLRFAEMGRVGTVLEAVCEVRWELLDNASAEQTISALLIASAKLAERMGGKRRRGSGKCRLEIVSRPISNSVINCLRAADASTPPGLKEENGEQGFAPASDETDWQKMEYTLTLKTPVSIVTATLGNVSESLDFIPGTYLLPHITKGNNHLFPYIANGDIQVSPATIEVNGERGLPAPKVIFYDKLGGGFDKVKDSKRTVYNKFNEADEKQIKSGEQKKNYRDGYISGLGESRKLPHHEKTPKTLLMHNTVKDEVQRPTEDVGGVYSRQAIAATRIIDDKACPTVLRGEIHFKKTLNLDFSNAPKEIRLGTSKKDDYGLAELRIGNANAEISTAPASAELIVYLESDVLLRNENLRQTNLVCDLKKLLESELDVALEKMDSLIQTRRIESWNVGWSFPRPTLLVMAAGSCVKFQVTGFENMSEDENKKLTANLQFLEASGIGERRGEGYGRIRFNPRVLTESINGWSQAEKSQTGDSTSEKKGHGVELKDKKLIEFAGQLELTAWREELHRAVLSIADDEDKRQEIFGFERKGSDSVPPLNQIGGLRSAIMRLKVNSSVSKKLITDWLEHLEETSNRIKKWDKDNNPERAKDKTKGLKELINQDSKVWLILCEGEVDGKRVWQSPPMLVRTKEEMQKLLWAEAVRALFDACMRAHKREERI